MMLKWIRERLGYVLGCCLLLLGCDPLVTQFEPVDDAVFYQAKQLTSSADVPAEIKAMTWNIRFAAGRKIPWFGDSCGDRVILTADEVYAALENLAKRINDVQPDILLLQEVDVQSKRTAYIDQVQWLLDHTSLNYGAYATAWQAQYVPSDGLGRMDMGNAVLSKWKIEDAERIGLPQRGDQDALTRYFYLQRNMIKTKIKVPGLEQFYVVNIHADAFSTDDTKRKHILRFKEELDRLSSTGALFIAGGISAFVNQAAVMRYLGPKANKGVAYGVASVSGTVLAVCSCTVLPLFAGIYRMGAGLGPASAFLYAGPAINILAIILTARILGLEMGIARAVGAIGFAVVIGLLMHLIFRREEQQRGDRVDETSRDEQHNGRGEQEHH